MFNFGHWVAHWDFDPNDWCGFVYCITNNVSGQKYIGKKFFELTQRKKVKGRKNRIVKTKDSGWKNYTGSSKSLNEDIQKNGKDNFLFEILSLHECRSTLAYEETKQLVLRDALRAKLPNGYKAYYNGIICGIKYVVKDETDIEKQYKI